MKQIGSAIEVAAHRAALDKLEANVKAGKRKAPGSPQETPGRAEGPGGVVRSLERERAAQRAAEATQLEALARKAGASSEIAAQLADGLRTQAPHEWTFLMVSTAQNAAVIDWLSENSRYPKMAVRLWGYLLDAIRYDTGEVLKSRAELAERLGIEPRTVSELMTELASINAVRRERQGNKVRFYLNASIATHLPGQAARKAAREADGPLLVVMQGGRAAAPD